jgi:hypothetical protein
MTVSFPCDHRLAMRALSILVLQAVALAATGCLAVSNLDHIATPTPTPPDRTDCGEILGTAFRSNAEQAWFMANCSKWAETTLGEVTPAPRAPETTADPRPSAQPDTPTPQPVLTGRLTPSTPTPSSSDGQRRTSRPTQTASTPATRSCDALRGRPYTRPGDRQWFLENCQPTPATDSSPRGQSPGTAAPVGPKGRTCGQIYGTRYWSRSEHEWFRQNC